MMPGLDANQQLCTHTECCQQQVDYNQAGSLLVLVGNEAWQEELMTLPDLARCEVALLPLTALARVRYLNATNQQVIYGHQNHASRGG
jgi:hypothetical protein